MKFFRHYKNKPYRYIGIAKHSESLDDVVIYETLYENKLATLWVRPKEMFFSDIEKDGVTMRRFAPVPLEITMHENLSSADIDNVCAMAKKVFTDWDEVSFRTQLKEVKNPMLLLGRVDGNPVGFKLGYERVSGQFHSWQGGVLEEFRRLGIAQDLMTAQQEWCKASGYKILTTGSYNAYREMLILNLKSGFEIVGTEPTTSERGVKVLLRKILQTSAI